MLAMDPSSLNPSSEHVSHKYKLKVLQQPSKARLCSFREKVDRRPIDPPPIVQLYCTCHHQQPSPQQQQCYHYSLHNPYFFLYANLTSITDDADLYIHHGHRTTAGAVVQSLHKLKDPNNNDGGFFVFADISVRLEGNYRLKFTLFEIVGDQVHRLESVISDPFTVYSPKYFPGMSESSLLTRLFSDQGVRIRIRKDTRPTMKRQKMTDGKVEDTENDSIRMLPRNSEEATTPTPTRSAMSVQNILSPPPLDTSHGFYTTRTLPPPTRLLSGPLPPVLLPRIPHTASSLALASSASASSPPSSL